MNETTRERNDLQSRGTAARPNVELETTTTTIEQNRSQGSAESGGAQNVADRARAEVQETRERAGQVGERARRAAGEAGEEVRRRTRETAEVVRERAAEQAAMAKERAAEQANAQKDGFATKICDVGGALKRAAEDLEQHDDAQLASQTRRLADSVEGIGNHLRDTDMVDLLHDAEQFVRRHPTAALGGLFIAGLSVARFLKAQPPRYQSPRSQQSTGGTNPYLQRQVGSTPRPAQQGAPTVGSSDLKIGSTDPTSSHRQLGSKPSNPSQGSGSTPGSSMAGGQLGASTPGSGMGPGSGTGASGSTSGSAPAAGGSGACPTPTSGQAQGNKSQTSNPSSGPSGGSAPRPR